MSVQQEPGVVSHPSFPWEPLLHSLSLTPPSHCSFSKRKFRGVPKTTLRFSKAVILPFLLFYRESSQMKISTKRSRQEGPGEFQKQASGCHLPVELWAALVFPSNPV